MNSQIIEIWKYFSLNNVKYLTIGGFAVNIYGYGRNTGDIDIFIEDTDENRENLRVALKKAGIGDFENIKTMQFIPGWTDITLNFNLRLDIMTSVKGLENTTFKELLEKAYITEISGIPVYFLDYENLIKAKKAANRPKDILDIEELEKINKNSNP
ncbi:MAG: nucleotidyltransferase [Flavobacterium sp.]|jgi:predicted nucleotidyltransferase|uniref:nucleotidyltransferase n=1 Tax=Flavobacterium TaxID=237 RepID=UPI0022C01833|nr:nucleotidyltransferase [Flavobacterium sp.]MCZ8090611.1 nucleotidyltransferase [Flavobacterium sp.]MCZ8330588.1 nucleotidyltransferase [Flavobacterium sp.]